MKSEQMIVTVRVPKELYNEFQNTCSLKGETMTKILVEHIEQQKNNYKEPKSNDKDYDNYQYKKVNFRIDTDLYTEYKIVLIRKKTIPTADIIRYMRTFVS